VALDNPYKTDKNEIALKVLLEGNPKPNAQVELFEKPADGEVNITLYQTDTNGEVTIPVKRGHAYLADSVEMLPLANNDPTNGPVWKSLWASLTFFVPQKPLK
jgi:hypothetical protein